MARLARSVPTVLTGLLTLCCATVAARAHPHVFVNVEIALVVEAGAITAVRHTWRFDEDFARSTIEEYDIDRDGKLSAAELAPSLALSTSTLTEFKGFTTLRQEGTKSAGKLPVLPPRDVTFEIDAHGATMAFIVPLAKPQMLPGSAAVHIDIYDPTYFSAFEFSGEHAATFTGAVPTACGIAIIAAPNGEQLKDYKAFTRHFGTAVMKGVTPKSIAISCRK